MTNRSEYQRVLLISNSTLYGNGYLDHAEGEIRKGVEPVETLPGDRLDDFVNGKASL
jgi:hypothetical protein